MAHMMVKKLSVSTAEAMLASMASAGLIPPPIVAHKPCNLEGSSCQSFGGESQGQAEGLLIQAGGSHRQSHLVLA